MLPISSWKDAIVDKSNIWFNAIEMERQGRFIDALTLYLKDSKDCLTKNSLVKAALDLTCAANCLKETGNFADAQQLYSEAALLYEENSSSLRKDSIREFIWSLNLACKYHVLGGNVNRAEELTHKLSVLMKRIDPFIQSEAEARNMFEFMDGVIKDTTDVNSRSHSEQNAVKPSAEASHEVQEFLLFIKFRATKQMPNSQDAKANAPHKEETTEGSSKIEESIASKLG